MCIFCILLNISGCRILMGKTNHTVFSDNNREVSFIGGTDKSLIGIVLDKRELLLYSYDGTEKWREFYDQDVQEMDILHDCVLLVFADNHIEEFQLVEGKKEALGMHTFAHPIENAEFTSREYSKKPLTTVLLTNGELYINSSDDLSLFSLLDENVSSFAYDVYSDVMLYSSSNGKLICYSYGGHNYQLDENLQKLQNVEEVERASSFANCDGDILFFVRWDSGSAYVLKFPDTKVFSLSKTDPYETKVVGVSKSVSKGMLYERNGKLYYEGPSHNDRHYYGSSSRENYIVSIPDGYNIHVIQGGIVYYNDHEVKVKLIP